MRAIYKEIEKERLRALCDVSALEKLAREKKEQAENNATENDAAGKDARPHFCLRGCTRCPIGRPFFIQKCICDPHLS